MGYINQEKIIGWYNGSTNTFFCDECFSKKKGVEEKNCKPIEEDEMDSKDMYICDECGEKFCGS